MADWRDLLFGRGPLTKAAQQGGATPTTPPPAQPAGIDVGALAQQQAARQLGTPLASNDPRDFSERYNTSVPENRQGALTRWATGEAGKTGRNPLNDRYDYDVNGYFLSGAGNDPRGHGPDTFKKPNHPTFSEESMYSGPPGKNPVGGRWIATPGADFFEPTAANRRYQTQEELQSYFNREEPKVTLLNPPGMPPLPGSLSEAARKRGQESGR